jgi:hypothetical protein
MEGHIRTDPYEQIEREVTEAEYMRYAGSGFARTASATRASDST